jgi:hypothetical protein
MAVNPLLLPLPGNDEDDADFTNPLTIARARGYSPAHKAAGSRQKSKGKQRADGPVDTSSQKHKHNVGVEEDVKPVKRGCPYGSGNYSQDDLKALLDLAENELPLGQKGWQAIHAKYVKWARKHNRPERALKSLETKFKQVCC